MAKLIYEWLFASCSIDLLKYWKVFNYDKDRPNRYLLDKKFPSWPNVEDLKVNNFNSGVVQSNLTIHHVYQKDLYFEKIG